MTLAEKLQGIAQGDWFDMAALREVILRDDITVFDQAMIVRYMHGEQSSSDRFRLQDLVIYLSA